MYKKPNFLMFLFNTHGSKIFLKLTWVFNVKGHIGVWLCVLNIHMLVYLNQEIEIEL